MLCHSKGTRFFYQGSEWCEISVLKSAAHTAISTTVVAEVKVTINSNVFD